MFVLQLKPSGLRFSVRRCKDIRKFETDKIFGLKVSIFLEAIAKYKPAQSLHLHNGDTRPAKVYMLISICTNSIRRR